MKKYKIKIGKTFLYYQDETFPRKIRDQYTDGKFVTDEEYARIIRKLKLNKINK